ncbi:MULTISPECIES: metal ABC transporter permease [unclassified Arthrobacter]|uniref:metal ABC transporter permease n=1 Tax=unclassified Arthrobacter TaxID=235627 RepID=UPI001D155068|nr:MULTISPECIES: metal ABC transporter permease [unclassified Arthrobacter]MCC3276900.1 metal ABC transporter permease [Arthrobacter sp. zg-Y20]MCC3277667.1 metal ABC transporter permease [Arthrobacter sp. zg-Y40]MCC9176072.1 metal ABC transporter permease [Arthrobacter sp. zg-Y750]MDK1317061.1 metal ABC transporter permease [Arthrobacter sp. zg.Y20]WIB05229.1 metal ABC transporter permease [Arthrobacter sp. zg-Y20]
MDLRSFFDAVFDFSDYGELLPLVQNSIWAAAILGLVGGLIGTFVLMRDLAFAVHGIAELSFAGASFALLIGANVVVGSLAGSVAAAVLLAVMGLRARDRNSIIGVIMPFGLGLGILFLGLYEGRSANKFGLLTGQIVAVDAVQLNLLAGVAAVVVAALLFIWRPLTFASADPDLAEARGVPVRVLSIVFMFLLGLAVALSIQVVGALLVLSLLITPAAAALLVTSSPRLVVFLSVAFALVSSVGGILLALGGRIPISPYVTTVSFVIYLVCRIIRRVRSGSRRELSRNTATAGA